MKRFVATLSLLVGLLPAVASATEPRFFDDAALRAVQYVGDNEAWAVGDEGVIWHTINNGKDWDRIPSGTRASLRSLCFITPEVGWIVGREELPRGVSAGVVLFTANGGIKWQRVMPNVLPGLNRVRFVDEKTGFLMGDGTDHQPGGLFKTTDGGQTWKPLSGARATSWCDGDFSDGETGALGGMWARLAKLRGDQITAADVDPFGNRAIRAMRLMDQRSVAAGDGGLILLSKSKGGAWGYADLKLPPEVLANLDFHSIDSIGNHVWVVGRPGSIVMHSADGGLTWDRQKTGQALPLYGVYFRDEKCGLAVGALGTTLITTDGGKSWQIQRQGGQRAAALFIHADGSTLPVEAVAELGIEEGYLVTGLRVAGPDPKSAAPSRATEEPRFAAALRQAGGAAGETLWQFPVPEHLGGSAPEKILAGWDSLHGKQAGKELLRQLVLALRVWRPEIVVTDHPDAVRSGSATGSVIADAVSQAVKLAGDPQAYPEQLQELGLQAWQAAKVYSVWDKATTAHVTLDGNEPRDRLQTSLRDFALPAAAVLAPLPGLPVQRLFHLTASSITGAASLQRLMAGTEVRAAQGAKRTLPPLGEPDPELVLAMKAKRNLQILAENTEKGLAQPDQLLAQVKPVLDKLPLEQGAAAAFALGNQFARTGRWHLAHEVFLAMVEQYPAHPLTAHAYRWLIQHNTSTEVRRRYELGQYVRAVETTITPPDLLPSPDQLKQILEEQKKKGMKSPGGATNGEPGPLPVDLSGADLQKYYKGAQVNAQPLLGQPAFAYLTNQIDLATWQKQTLDFAARLKAFGPILANDPPVLFCLQAARRNGGDVQKAHEFYRDYKSSPNPGTWQQVAASEYWLNTRQGLPPRPLLECQYVTSKPFLDGDLSDPCWQAIKPMVLGEVANKAAQTYRTEVRLAFDEEFLYVAVTCTHPPEGHVPPAKTRARDEDLRAYDRVSLLLDLDRDYSTYFHLQVDQRGCVAEDCWGDPSWNPKWYVAVRSNETSWNVEAAIPLSQLTGQKVTTGTVWAGNIVRIVPGHGVQAVSLPAGVEPRPEGMGLLMFLSGSAAQSVQPAAHTMPAAPK